MTVFSPPRRFGPWTAGDLVHCPPDGSRYELIEGSLLVSPAVTIGHVRTVSRLRDTIEAALPDDLAAGENLAVLVGSDRTSLLPDLVVVDLAALDGGRQLAAVEVRLVVEVLSPHNAAITQVTKRHLYAAGGIPRFWIVDPVTRRVTVHVLDGGSYRDETVIEAGHPRRIDAPFPTVLDPATFC